MTILIVDDEFRIGQLIRRLIHFEELGLELIDVFDDSEKALGAILLHHPDVVISDIKMPGMDGLELVRHCWQLPQLNELVEQAIAEELQTQQKELDNQTARPVRMALDYIAENYAQKIGLDEIAEMLQMNSSYFSTLFKKETGRNFQNYLTEYRIEKAKELLRTTNETMMSVAEQVGYQDTRYFSQCFVKVVGVKPSLYRKMYS